MNGCAEGQSGIYQEYDRYFLGIKVGSGHRIECVDNAII